MSRDEFLSQLMRELSDLPIEEAAEACRYYREYFDEAGPEGEAEALRALGSPAKIAAQIRAGQPAADKPTGAPAPASHRRRLGVWAAVLALTAVLIAVILPAVFHSSLNGDTLDINTPDIPSIQENLVPQKESHSLAAFTNVDATVISADILLQYGDEYRLDITWDNSRLKPTFSVKDQTLSIQQKSSDVIRSSGSGSIVITVPEGESTDVISCVTVSGDVRCELPGTTLTLASVSGDLKAEAAVKTCSAMSTSGDISLELPSFTSLSLSAVSGTVEVQSDIPLSDCALSLNTMSGDVAINGEDQMRQYTQENGDRSILAETTSGNIDILLPQ